VDAARLRRDADIAVVWSEGMRIQHSLFALRARPNGLDVIRVAVAAPLVIGTLAFALALLAVAVDRFDRKDW